MKKILLSLSLALGLAGASQAASISITLLPGTMTNLLGVVNGSAKITQAIVSTSVGTNLVEFVDSPTNVLVYPSAPYTNTVSYATNATFALWTNYNGVVNSNQSFVLVDVTNNVVTPPTNNYPVRLSLATTGNLTVRADQVNYYFNQGVWLTNAAASGLGGNALVTITYQQ